MIKLKRDQNRHSEAIRCRWFRRRGFTITELLVVLAVIGLLASITLPAVQQSRAASRRTQCLSNLRQLGIAAQNYESIHGILPGYRGQSMFELLPELGHSDPKAVARRNVKLLVLLCPDDSPPTNEIGWGAVTNYLVNGGACFRCYNGIHPRWYPGNGPSRLADIGDGTSHTALFAERLFEFMIDEPASVWEAACAAHPERCVWYMNSTYTSGQEDRFVTDCNTSAQRTSSHPLNMNPGRGVEGPIESYSHVLPPNSMTCYSDDSYRPNAVLAATSRHWGGANVVFADGHARFISNQIDLRVWRALGSRNGNDTTGEY